MGLSSVRPDNAVLLCILLALAQGCDERPEERFGSAGEHFMRAQDALAAGDSAAAMEALNASIDAGPNPWAYLQRAQLHLEQGDADAAKADAEAGLETQPENRDLKWLATELRKPPQKRFKGRFAEPPSVSK